MKMTKILISLSMLTALMGSGTVADAAFPSTPDATVLHVSRQLAEGHPEVLWNALPPSYREDLTGLTHDFAGKMDPEVWNRTFAVTTKAVKLLKDKKALFFQTSFFNMAGEKKDEIAGNWDTVTTTLDTLLSSDVSSLEKLQQIDWKHYLATTGAKLMKIAKEASAATRDNAYEKDFLARVRGMTVKVKESSGDSATLVVSSPNEEPEDMKLMRVEGRWVPVEMAEEWEKKMTDARAKVEALTPEAMAQQKMQFMMFLGMAEGMIDQLNQAQSAEQLEQMLGGIFGQFMKSGPASAGEAPAAEPKTPAP